MKQIINPYIRFKRKAQGRYANRIGSGTYARAVTVDEEECFFVVDAFMGIAASNGITVCFNKNFDNNCFAGWTFKKNGVAFTDLGLGGISQPCLIFTADDGIENNSAGPSDTITLDYTPGTCSADGQADCLLKELTDYPVENLIYGPIAARVGDSDPNIIIVYFDVAPSVIGDFWRFKVNGSVRDPISSQIVGNSIEFTISDNVTATDTVVYSQGNTGTSNRCKAVDGRECYWFYDEPVDNVIGTDYWALADGSQAWLLASGADTWSVANA